MQLAPAAPPDGSVYPRLPVPRPAWFTRLRADPARMTAVRESWRALWSSRALVSIAGVATIAAFGFGPTRKAFNPPGLTHGFGWLGNLLAAPVARWDSAWYLEIARFGYRPDLGAASAPRDAYFPLYPMALRAIAWLGAPPVLAGVLISTAAFALALYGIHRLTTLELAGAGRRRALAGGAGGFPEDAARLAVLVMAFAPMAFFFSAVYSESLYLALSVGVFWNARHGRWAWVGVLGALASATRNTGLVLLLPAAMIYLYGPREDRPPDRTTDSSVRRMTPRYRLGHDWAWLALMPLGTVLFGAYLGLEGGSPLGFMHAEGTWGRHLTAPFVGAWEGLGSAFDGARQLLSLQSRHIYFAPGGANPTVSAEHDLLMIVFLAFALAATIGVLRTLPFAYGAYVIAALALPLSDPVRTEPLQSLPRFMVVLFPLGIWVAARLAERPRARRPVLTASGLAMVLFLAQFATWHWVA